MCCCCDIWNPPLPPPDTSHVKSAFRLIDEIFNTENALAHFVLTRRKRSGEDAEAQSDAGASERLTEGP